jgi:hypothetical protein
MSPRLMHENDYTIDWYLILSELPCKINKYHAAWKHDVTSGG